MSNRRTLILPIGAGVIGIDDVPLVRIMDSDETPTSITTYGVVDTVQPVLSVTWTVNGVEQEGDVTKSPVLELTDLQPETSYAITLRATNVNGESQASTKTIWTKRITTITPADVVDGVTYYDYQDVFQTGTMPENDENDIVVSGRDVTVPAGHYANSETVSVSSEYIIPTGTKNITNNGNEDVTQYANVNVNVPASAIDTGTKQTNITTNGTQTVNVVGYANNEVTVNVPASAVDTGTKQITTNGTNQDVVGYAAVDVNVQPTLYHPTNVTPTTSQQTISAPQGYDGLDSVTVNGVNNSIDPNIQAGNIKDGVTILGVQGSYQGSTCNLERGKIITTNGIHRASDDGYDGFEQVNVYVDPIYGTLNVTQNGNYDVFDDPDYGPVSPMINAYRYVNVTVPTVNPTGTLNISNNGNYNVTNYANVNVQVVQGDYNFLCFTANEANCMIQALEAGSPRVTIYYSRDKQSWTAWDYSPITLTNQNDKVYFYGNNFNGFNKGISDYMFFTTNGSFTVSGNIMTLISMYGDREYIPNEFCFAYLFKNANITDASNLQFPATKLKGSCYFHTFENCSNLTSAPALPATKLADGCYNNMFRNCTSLTTAPVLPATTLAQYCYFEMFLNCTSLVTAPALPATRLVNRCYHEMFSGCTSLVTAPELPATTLVTQCYLQMFRNCSSLNYIKVLATSWNTSAATDWVSGVAATGTFDKPCDTVIPTATNGIPSGWTVIDHCLDPNMLHFTANQNNSTIGYTSSLSAPPTMYKSTDGVNFTSWDGTAVTLNQGDTLWVYGANQALATDTATYTNFVMTGSIAADGDVTYLLQNGGTTTLSSNYAMYKLFNGCSSLTTAPSLPATTLTENCYRNMFGDCSSLTIAPALPATTLDDECYSAMFYNCTSLTTGPTISATTLAYKCCDSMFMGCTGLTTAPQLQATTMAESCYDAMFNGCTSLTTAPSLSGTTLAKDCYKSMFMNCSSLTTPPTLPATNLTDGCYRMMFLGCSSLTSAPALNATTMNTYSYAYMFSGCSSLTTPPALPATTLAEACYQYMFQNCTGLTTAPNLSATTMAVECYDGMFSGCTALTTAPSLPATTIANGCYVCMFEGCTSLTTAPILSIATLANSCYRRMFKGCSSLSSITCFATSISAFDCTVEWVDGVAASGTFTRECSMLDWTTGVNGIPSGWTVVDNCPPPSHYVNVSPSTLTFDNSNLTATFTVTSDEAWTLTDNCNGSKYVLYDHTLNCPSFQASYDGSYDWHAPANPVGDGTDSVWLEWKIQSPQVVSKQEYIDGCNNKGVTVSGLDCDSSGYYLELRPTTGRQWLSYSVSSGSAGTTTVTVTCGLSSYAMTAAITITTANASATVNVTKN